MQRAIWIGTRKSQRKVSSQENDFVTTIEILRTDCVASTSGPAIPAPSAFPTATPELLILIRSERVRPGLMFSTMRPGMLRSAEDRRTLERCNLPALLAFIMAEPMPVIARQMKKPTSLFMKEEINAKVVKVETPARKTFLLPTGISDVTQETERRTQNICCSS
jgi:hypothetical protein